MKTLFLEMERLRNLNSGLGQFCKNLGEAVLRQTASNFDPVFFVPPSAKGIFGADRRYIVRSPVHNFVPPSRLPFDLWHCLHQDSRYLPSTCARQTKLVLTIHDLNFMAKYSGPRMLRKRAALQKKIDRSAALVFPTRFTETTVREHFTIGNRITRIVPYGNCLDTTDPGEAPKDPPQGPFIFSIGIIGPKKNIHVLVPFLAKLKEYSLVIAGDNSGSYAEKILDDAHHYGVIDRVSLVGTLSEREKVWWYRHCAAFAFPSLAEGFGLPVVEAMSLGKPVFLSPYTSLPEVGGAEAYYWHSFDPAAMVHVFEAGMREYGGDREKSRRITAWAQTFSWENTAQRHEELYNELSS
jgi:glycosyltransferase involved in cell wall biosynthesis